MLHLLCISVLMLWSGFTPISEFKRLVWYSIQASGVFVNTLYEKDLLRFKPKGYVFKPKGLFWCFEQNSYSFRVTHFRLFDDFKESLSVSYLWKNVQESSNINEVIRAVSNFLFFFMIRFYKYKKAQNVIKTIQFFSWCR